MAEIFYVRALNQYDDYAVANVYYYKDEDQGFFFDGQFTEEVPPVLRDGVVVQQPRYSVLVSKIGKTDAVSGTIKPVENLNKCKDEITDYFKTHPLGIARTLPQSVIFG